MLVIEGLSKTYGNDARALDDVSLTIRAGKFGLLRPNGAGKSTLMRAIVTLQPADRGSIHFKGIDASAEPDRIWAILGYLPQDFTAYPRINTGDLLDHIALLKTIAGPGAKRCRRCWSRPICTITARSRWPTSLGMCASASESPRPCSVIRGC